MTQALAQNERDLVAAVLDGKTIQYNETHDTAWWNLDTRGFFDHLANPRAGYTYRVKPEHVVRYMGVHANGDFGAPSLKREVAQSWHCGDPFKVMLRVELDPDSLAVIRAVTEAV